MEKGEHHIGAREPYVDPVVEAYKSGIDQTLIQFNLRLTHQERLEQLEALMRGIEEMNRAGRAARRAS
jgi:hypothetical protein